MHIHILGIGGTFMAGIAQLAKTAGYTVSGSDHALYPPMSTQLHNLNIPIMEGYDPNLLDPSIDCVIVGNVIARGNPVMEYIMERNIPYLSGPQWLANNILHNRWVLAVAGTHGKTTTTSLLAFILEYAGLDPGFLIGGVPENLLVSARMGNGHFFVIEADEYDSAFFDKRPKFMHYHPRTLVLNNLEYDHADIYPDLQAIKQQFHYLVRTVPPQGLIIHHQEDENLTAVLEKGLWSKANTFGESNALWQAQLLNPDGSAFKVLYQGIPVGDAQWNLLGQHNVNNALAAIAAAYHAGVPIEKALAALPLFKNVKRRLEIKGEAKGITIYDDFAHHPTAIATTLAGLRAKVGQSRIIVVLEFGSYTMRVGVHKNKIAEALSAADMVLCKKPDAEDWGLEKILTDCLKPTGLFATVDLLVQRLAHQLTSGDHVVVMSNSGFGNIHEKLLRAIG